MAILFCLFLGYTQNSSGVSPGFNLSNQSYLYQARGSDGGMGIKPGGSVQDKLPIHCAIAAGLPGKI